MKICIVSPHLDDAILSCGVLMQRAAAKGDEVISLNIFTDGTNAGNRHIEERAAAKHIGAKAFFLEELDAPDRNPLYLSTIKIFFGDFADVPAEYIAKVEKRVRDFLITQKIDIAYFPLAAGTHIDHRIAHEVGRRIKNMPVKFYEDRPYILWPGVLQGRMNQLGSDAQLSRVTQQMMMQSLQSYHYLKHFVPKGEYQRVTLPQYIGAATQQSTHNLRSKSETHAPATPEELRKLYNSLALYTSQMKYIYADYDNFVADNFSYGQGVYAERYWTLG